MTSQNLHTNRVPREPEPAGRYTAPMPIKQIAALLSVHRNTAARYLTEGQIKAKRLGGRWRLHVDELPADYERLPQMA